METKPIIEIEKRTKLHIIIQYVFKANFNDSYWLEDYSIELADIKGRDELVWFDPYREKSKSNEVLVALKYASDEKFIILEKRNDIITEFEVSKGMDHIVCEDYNDSMLLAAHVSLR